MTTETPAGTGPQGATAWPALELKLFATRPERDRRGSAVAFAGSFLAHALLVGLVVFLTSYAAGEVMTGVGGAPDPSGLIGGGGGGGERIEMLVLVQAPPQAAQAPVEEVEEPVVVPEPIEIEIPPVPIPEIVAAVEPVIVDSIPLPGVLRPTGGSVSSGTGGGPGSGTGSGGGIGSGVGTGIGDGVGSGSGGGRGGGDGALGRPPSPLMLLLPPPAPGNLRGRSVKVQLTVDNRGIVREVELIPSTGDDAFDRLLHRTALEWRFRPGTDAQGRPIARVFEIVFSF